MQVGLVTCDGELRDFVSAVVGPGLICSKNGSDSVTADLYLWDFNPDSGFPVNRALGCNYLFLVDRRDLIAFAEHAKEAPLGMLLKPLNRPTFEAFLETYQQNWQSRADQKSLRSDRDVLLQHLLQANLKLQEYDHERTNFLARALHDLRAPLTALEGFCGLLMEGQVGPINKQQEELLRNMYNSSRRIARLSSGMFELSVNGRVRRTLQLEQTDIEGCLNQALHEVCALAQEKKLRLTSQIEPPKSIFYSEPPQIEQLLVNLLENACKFTPRSGEIDIHGYSVSFDPTRPRRQDLTARPNAYRIDIRDSGPGIEEGCLEKIFEQYTSYGGSSDRSGGGLGLAIAKLVVSAHGGAIWATSTSHGATLSLVLPFEPRMARSRPRLMTETYISQNARAV